MVALPSPQPSPAQTREGVACIVLQPLPLSELSQGASVGPVPDKYPSAPFLLSTSFLLLP